MKLLVAWYGLVQTAHIIVIVRALIILLVSGSLSFPALPPAGGWSAQAQHFLIATGAIDAVNAVLSLIFVRGYFTRARWARWLGTMNLTASIYSALLFAYGTIASGAWAGGNLVGYLAMTIVFVPVIILFIVHSMQAMKGGY